MKICKRSRVGTSQVDLDLIVEVTEFRERSGLNPSEILVWEVSLYSYEAMVYVDSVVW